MKTPTYWNGINLSSLALWPLGLLYGTATVLRQWIIRPKKVNAKVICIGNLTAGGTGKTPVSVSIAAILQKQHKKTFFLTRGYGGKLQDITVLPQHNATDVGDEPLILARQAPVIVNSKRYDGALKAVDNGAEYIIMDDGYQNPSLYKDLSFLVIDGGFGLGNGFCIPAGPLREFCHYGSKRANAIILLGNDEQNICKKFSHLPTFKGSVVPIQPRIVNPRVIAFAGIGRPSKFYDSLRSCGFNIIKTYDFPDHYFYQDSDIEKLIAAAKKHNAVLYTTAKDIVKIPVAKRPLFNVLEITINWEDEQALTKFLLS